MADTPTVYASGTLTPVLTNRSVSDAVTNTTTTVTSATASFVSGDVGRVLTGTADLGVFNWLATESNSTTILLAVAATGTHTAQTLNLTQEWMLHAVNAAGLYAFRVDISAMASGDVMELYSYEVCLTTGTPRKQLLSRFAGAPPATAQIADFSGIWTPLTDAFALVFTLNQTLGSAKAFPWSITQF